MKLFLALTTAFLAASATPALACAVQPPPMPLDQIKKTSDAVVYGQLDYGFRAFSGINGKALYTVGTIIPATILKGPRKLRFRINHEDMDTPCQAWGWEPRRTKPLTRYAGTFYLFANRDGTYSIARYSPKAER